MEKDKTKCWSCRNSIGGCSWSRDGIPVEGWVAEQDYLKDEKEISYNVLKCPLYSFDKIQISAKKLAEILHIHERTVYRTPFVHLQEKFKKSKIGGKCSLLQLSDGTFVLKRKVSA